MNSRKIALDILQESVSNSFVSKDIWKKADRLSRADRGFVRRIVYGTLRTSLSLDREINRFLKNPGRTIPMLRNILRMGAYEILEMNVPAYATVNEYTEMAQQRFKGVVNAVLRRISESAAAIDLGHSLPDWLYSMLKKDLGEDTELFFENTDHHELSLRAVNVDRDELTEELSETVNCEPMKYSKWGVRCTDGMDLGGELFKRGDFTFQDESSQMVGIAAAPKPGERILDAFGGVGTKTTHLIQMEPEAVIHYNDISQSKSSIASENFRRLSLRPFKMTSIDVLKGDFGGFFDKVLVDAPCTALGTLGKHPDLLLRLKNGDVEEKARIQLAMLERLWNSVKPGGTVIYSVCTVTKLETDEVVEEFLKGHDDAKCADPFNGRFGYSGLGVQLLEYMEGFYIAKLLKGRE